MSPKTHTRRLQAEIHSGVSVKQTSKKRDEIKMYQRVWEKKSTLSWANCRRSRLVLLDHVNEQVNERERVREKMRDMLNKPSRKYEETTCIKALERTLNCWIRHARKHMIIDKATQWYQLDERDETSFRLETWIGLRERERVNERSSVNMHSVRECTNKEKQNKNQNWMMRATNSTRLIEAEKVNERREIKEREET